MKKLLTKLDPITDETVARILLQYYKGKTKDESAKVLIKIRKTLLQKCRRIFERCHELLFPEIKEVKRDQKKRKKEESETFTDSNNNSKILKLEKVTPKVVNNINHNNFSLQNELINETNEIFDYDEDDIDYNNNENEEVLYPFRHLMSELEGIKIFIFI